MRQIFFAFALAIVPASVLAGPTNDIVQTHILPGFSELADKSEELAAIASTECVASSDNLRAAYGDAFDAWIAVSHLRFGPTEVDDRAFALAFWPDSRGKTPKALNALINDQDPIAQTAENYSDVSIAARGFYALEFLLYDENMQTAGDDAYRCMLIQTVTADIAGVAKAINSDWQTYADHLITPTADGIYRSDEEALQELFKALSTGLQFTSETRLGRPLGTFDKPRPKRAESWRSGRSARHVQLSLTSLRDIALKLAGDDPDLSNRLEKSFDRVQEQLSDLDDPIFAGVAQPHSRFLVEVIQQSVNDIREIVGRDLGPKLGVAAGFNSLDGD